MSKRFFKLIYVIALIGIGISFPIYILTSIEFDKIIISSYKAQCVSNNEYVVIEGDSQPYILNEIILNDTTYDDTKKDLNFYCKYYDKVKPYVLAYIRAKNTNEQVNVNKEFFNFKNSVINDVYSYPTLYKLELVSEETNWFRVYGPLIEWFFIALFLFIILQILRMCYVYIVFGEIVWHPFRYLKK